MLQFPTLFWFNGLRPPDQPERKNYPAPIAGFHIFI
jgi:hypothetical protein